MTIRPIHDRIVVQRHDEGEQKVGGIIIPDSAKEKPQRGKVIAAGDGKFKDDGKRVPLDVKAGDSILFGKYSGQEIKLDGDEYLIMREDDVLAVVGEGGIKTKTRSRLCSGRLTESLTHQEQSAMAKQIVYGEQSRRRSSAASTNWLTP